MTDRDWVRHSRNPYNFSMPVNDPEFFSGRHKLREDIAYYLDQALLAPKPTNLALIGPRAAGKTSILNYIGWSSEERNICVAKMKLNEGDASSDLIFFNKMIDSVFRAATRYPRMLDDGEHGFPFNGRDSSTFDAYLEMTTNYSIPPDRKLRPLSFPVMFARAMSAGHRDVEIPDEAIEEDLALIRQEVGFPISILIDETNVISTRRSILQKIRNVFMDLNGYMLVICGTPDLFPVMDEVFSPVSRDFKRLEIGGFESSEEATECVLRPLQKIGISDASNWFHPETLRDLTDTQGLTAAMPYQIQLACHYLFRELQRDPSRAMRLNVDVIDAILLDIDQGAQQTNGQGLLQKLRRLSKQEFQALGRICISAMPMSIDEIGFYHRVVSEIKEERIEELQEYLVEFKSRGLIREQEGKFSFAGNERDALYAKYLARKLKAGFNPIPIDVATFIAFRMVQTVLANSKWNRASPLDITSPAGQLGSLPIEGLSLELFTEVEAKSSIATRVETTGRTALGRVCKARARGEYRRW